MFVLVVFWTDATRMILTLRVARLRWSKSDGYFGCRYIGMCVLLRDGKLFRRIVHRMVPPPPNIMMRCSCAGRTDLLSESLHGVDLGLVQQIAPQHWDSAEIIACYTCTCVRWTSQIRAILSTKWLDMAAIISRYLRAVALESSRRINRARITQLKKQLVGVYRANQLVKRPIETTQEGAAGWSPRRISKPRRRRWLSNWPTGNTTLLKA